MLLNNYQTSINILILKIYSKLWRLKEMCEKKKFCSKRFAVKNSDVSCQTLIFGLSNPKMNLVQVGEIRLFIYLPFFGNLIQTKSLVVKASSCVQGNMGLIPAALWNSVQPLGHFAWYQVSQWNDIFSVLVSSNLAQTEFYLLLMWTSTDWKHLG